MNIQAMLDTQKALDQKIWKEKNLGTKKMTDNKVAALYRELGELMEETKCFKYWSNKLPSPSKVILEEFVDGLHFILSIMNDRNVYIESVMISYITDKSLTEDFLQLFQKISRYQAAVFNNGDRLIKELLNEYISFGVKMGFTTSDIEDAYYRKNRINHGRQAAQY